MCRARENAPRRTPCLSLVGESVGPGIYEIPAMARSARRDPLKTPELTRRPLSRPTVLLPEPRGFCWYALVVPCDQGHAPEKTSERVDAQVTRVLMGRAAADATGRAEPLAIVLIAALDPHWRCVRDVCDHERHADILAIPVVVDKRAQGCHRARETRRAVSGVLRGRHARYG